MKLDRSLFRTGAAIGAGAALGLIAPMLPAVGSDSRPVGCESRFAVVSSGLFDLPPLFVGDASLPVGLESHLVGLQSHLVGLESHLVGLESHIVGLVSRVCDAVWGLPQLPEVPGLPGFPVPPIEGPDAAVPDADDLPDAIDVLLDLPTGVDADGSAAPDDESQAAADAEAPAAPPVDSTGATNQSESTDAPPSQPPTSPTPPDLTLPEFPSGWNTTPRAEGLDRGWSRQGRSPRE